MFSVSKDSAAGDGPDPALRSDSSSSSEKRRFPVSSEYDEADTEYFEPGREESDSFSDSCFAISSDTSCSAMEVDQDRGKVIMHHFREGNEVQREYECVLPDEPALAVASKTASEHFKMIPSAVALHGMEGPVPPLPISDAKRLPNLVRSNIRRDKERR